MLINVVKNILMDFLIHFELYAVFEFYRVLDFSKLMVQFKSVSYTLFGGSVCSKARNR